MPHPPLHHAMLAILQGGWVALRTPRLPEAAGARAGRIGRGPLLKLLIAGDSSAAGVGVAHQKEALAGQLTTALAGRFTVEWTLIALSGATTGTTAKILRSGLRADGHIDAAVLALGVNDVIRQVPLARWLCQQRALHDWLTGRLGIRHVYASGLPPMGLFPALPRTLARLLGARATRFDIAMADLSPSLPGHRYLPFAADMLDSSFMASDGFHPGGPLYSLWAETIARAIHSDFGTKP